MKKISFLCAFSAIFLIVACHKDKTDTPEGYIEYQGELLKETGPVRYDSNGDGVVDDNDKTIEILGTNLNISQNPDGSPLYNSSGNSSEDGDDESGLGSQEESSSSQVSVGEKLCYHDLAKYCEKNGGLYAFETSVNSSKSSVQETFTEDDKDKNGIPDYIETIRSTSNIESLATQVSETYTKATESSIVTAAEKQISENFVKETIKDAVVNALEEALYESNESIDITTVETIVTTRVATAIVAAINEAGLLNVKKLDSKKAAEIATETAQQVGTAIANSIATSTSQAILSQYESQVEKGAITHVQGICPNGYHIPSDVEWMIFEYALGMPATDLTKSGETEINRGASANIVSKMVNDFGFNFGGYASINGTYAQLDEAGVYWSSTTGTDDKGDYVWVRQIDTSYSGVVRFKMYEKSGLSVRCFKD